MSVEKVQPKQLSQRVVNGHMLYHHVIVTTGQKFAFISGQLARNAEAAIVGPGDMRAQIKQVGENLKAALETVGDTLENLFKTTTLTTDIDEFFKHVYVRHDYLGVALPASTTVEVRRLSHPDLLVEIEAVALLDR